MNNYIKSILDKAQDSEHLISMVSVEALIRFVHAIGLNESSRVLDLCCGYGTVLKLWSEAFGINGVGVDITAEFINKGKERLASSHCDKVELICGDVLQYHDDRKYDVVICSETFDSIESTLEMGAKFLKKGGILAYQKVYSKVPNPPQELLDFEGEVLPLSKLNEIFRKQGYFISYLATDSNDDWERYITWSARRDIARLQGSPDDEEIISWIDKWYRMYFDYRRPFQGQAMFGLIKI